MSITYEIRELVQELKEIEGMYHKKGHYHLESGVCIARVKIELLGEKHGMTRPTSIDSVVDNTTR